MKFKIPKKHFPDRHRPDTVFILEEWVGDQKYLVFKFPLFMTLNEVKQFVEVAWMKAQGHWIGKKEFFGTEEQLETRREREKYAQEKRAIYSKKKRPKRSKNSQEFYRWVLSRKKQLCRLHPYEPTSKIAEYIFEENEDRIASCKAEGKKPPRHYTKSSIQKLLYL